ncbi:hypothetical protein FF021_03585 [Leptospira noguchii]|nr:hypothetical protein FF021_03585 [Leptospira noguchii]
MIKKSFFILLVFGLGIGTSIWVIICNSTNDSIKYFSNIRKLNAQLNLNSEKIIEGCITLPLNQKLKNLTTSKYLRGGVIYNFTIHKDLTI